MKKILIYLLCFILSGINISYAWESFTSAPKLISSTSDSLSITWEKIDNASWYYIYYSETSWKNPKTFWDVFFDNKATITWLKSWQTYYVVITSLDKTSNEESPFSPEWTFNTKIWSEKKFALENIDVINPTILELTFNYAIDDWDEVAKEFKITKSNKDITDIKEVTINKTDDKKLRLALNKALEEWEYRLVVISITDKLWRNIEEWINWELKFAVTNNSNVKVNITNNEEVEIENENINLNSWDPESGNYWLAWKAMTWVLSTWEAVAANSQDLPKTWPESILLVFISMISWLIYFRKRKTI